MNEANRLCVEAIREYNYAATSESRDIREAVFYYSRVENNLRYAIEQGLAGNYRATAEHYLRKAKDRIRILQESQLDPGYFYVPVERPAYYKNCDIRANRLSPTNPRDRRQTHGLERSSTSYKLDGQTARVAQSLSIKSNGVRSTPVSPNLQRSYASNSLSTVVPLNAIGAPKARVRSSRQSYERKRASDAVSFYNYKDSNDYKDYQEFMEYVREREKAKEIVLSRDKKANVSGVKEQKEGKSKNNDDDAIAAKMEAAILQNKPDVTFKDVAGLGAAKQALTEAVIMPIKVPGMFTGATRPWRGILLYGPPGTGKSFLAKAVAGEANRSTFLTVSTADLTSKWVGESEKLIKSLFDTARRTKPSVVFIDEIDSLVSERGENETETGRRIKTEFLIQMDGVLSDNTGILIIGATNLPWLLDPGMRRRFEKRIYVPLPDLDARVKLIQSKLETAKTSLTEKNIKDLASKTDGYSGADISVFVRDALMQPIREVQKSKFFRRTQTEDVNGKVRSSVWVPCNEFDRGATETTWDKLNPNDLAKPTAEMHHFEMSLKKVRPTVSSADICKYTSWTSEYGEDGS